MTAGAVRDCYGLAKELWSKSWEWDLHRGFENLQHILGNIEGHTHSQACVYAQKRTEKTLGSYFLLTLRFCGNRKWRLRQSFKWLSLILKVKRNFPIQSKTAKIGRSFLFVCLFTFVFYTAFNEISIKSLANRTETSEETLGTTHNKEFTKLL